MIMDLIAYLLRNIASFEVAGIKSKSEDLMEEFFRRLDAEKEKMVRPVMEEFFARLVVQKDLALKQFAKLGVTLSGLFLTMVGIAYVIDELVDFNGIGFVVVGLLVLLGSMLMRDR